jgi:hypothetical protein
MAKAHTVLVRTRPDGRYRTGQKGPDLAARHGFGQGHPPSDRGVPASLRIREVAIEGRGGTEVSYHVQILLQAGMVQGAKSRPTVTNTGIDLQLTWAGHELLDAARDQGVWAQAKKRVGPAVASASMAVIQAVLTAEVNRRLVLG